MKNILKNPKTERILYKLSYLALGAAIFALHALARPNFSDDSWFASKLNEYTLPGYLIWRYTHWTSRLILESFLVILAHGHFLIWCAADTFVLLLLAASVRELLGMEKKAQNVFLTALLFGFVPAGILYSAGWIATSTNYCWPMVFAVYGILPISRFIRGEPIRKPEYITFTMAVILAANQEQTAALLCGLYIVTLVWRKKYMKNEGNVSGENRAAFRYLIFLTCLIFLSLLFIAACPGNAFRNTEEIRKWFPQYSKYSVFQRVDMGFLSTMSYYTAGIGNQMILPVFTGILAWSVWVRKTDIREKIFSVIPFAAVTFAGFPVRYSVKEGLIWHPSFYYDLIANVYLSGSPQCNYALWQVTLENICFLGLLVWIGILLYQISDTWMECAVMNTALAAGLCSRWMVGLSPTVYASGYRTTLFCTTILQILELHMIQKLSGKKMRRVLYILLIFLLAVTVWFESDGKTY